MSMPQGINEVSRRGVLKGLGAAGIAGSAAAGGLYQYTRGATATAGGTIENPDTAVSDDGRIKYVATQTTGRMEWDGFDEPAKYGRIVVSVELRRNDETQWVGEIHDTEFFDLTQGSDWGSPGDEVRLAGDYGEGRAGHIASDADWGICQRNRENHYDSESGEDYPLPENPAPTSYFTAHEDGSTKKTRVVLISEYRLYDADQNELTGQSGYPDRPEARSSFVVTVQNDEAETSFGDEDAEGDTEDSAEVGI